MEYFLVRYDSRVVIYESKMFIRLGNGHQKLRTINTRGIGQKFDQASYGWLNNTKQVNVANVLKLRTRSGPYTQASMDK